MKVKIILFKKKGIKLFKFESKEKERIKNEEIEKKEEEKRKMDKIIEEEVKEETNELQREYSREEKLNEIENEIENLEKNKFHEEDNHEIEEKIDEHFKKHQEMFEIELNNEGEEEEEVVISDEKIELDKLVKAESKMFQFKTWIILLVLWLFIMIATFLRGGRSFPSVIPFIEYCSIGFWIIFSIPFPVLILFSVIVAFFLNRKTKNKIRIGYDFIVIFIS
jgi:hypothetical protein